MNDRVLLTEKFPEIRTINLKDYTTWKIGGEALCLDVNSVDYLCAVSDFLKINDVHWFVLGAGSNILASDEYRGLIVRLTGEFVKTIWQDTKKGWKITAGAGTHLPSLAGAACMKGGRGLVFAVGIPGTVGGAIFMNAGAYGNTISECITTVRIVTGHGKKLIINACDCNFSYRCSRFQEKKEIITGVEILLDHDDPCTLKNKAREILELRRRKFPLDYPNAGSVFRRPVTGPPPGELIEQAGLKGYRVGGSVVSSLHANFILNMGDATFSDICSLISIIKDRVVQQSGILLEEEVQYLI